MNDFIQANIIFILYAIVAVLFISFILIISLFLRFGRIKKLSDIFFEGKNGKDLELVILEQKEQIRQLDKDTKDLFDGYEKIYKMASKGISRTGIVRFNPFNDIGGNQSFAIALLDSDKSGIVISSLHTREVTRVYTKAIVKGDALSGQLTDEEKKAIKIAKISKKSAQI